MGFSCLICILVIALIQCCHTHTGNEMRKRQFPNSASIGQPDRQGEIPEEFFAAYRPSVRQTGIYVQKALDRLESGHNDDFRGMDDLLRPRKHFPTPRPSSTRNSNIPSTEELNLRQRYVAIQPDLETEDMIPESGIEDGEYAEAYPSKPHLDGGDYRQSSSINRDMKNDQDFNSLLNSVNSNPQIAEEESEIKGVGKGTVYDKTTKSPSFINLNNKRKNKSKLSRLGRLYKELAERMVDAEIGQSHHAIPQSLLDEETFDNSQPISIKDFMSEKRNLEPNREHEIDPKNATSKKVENFDNTHNKKLSDSKILPKNNTKGKKTHRKTVSRKKSPPSSLKGESGDTGNAISNNTGVRCGNMTCENDGKCDSDAHKCVCAAGFKGNSCEEGSTKGWFKEKAGWVKQKLKDHAVTVALSVTVAILGFVIAVMLIICFKKRDVSGN